MKQVYDMLIIGGGPGGYTAALYGARAGFSTLVVERMAPGGQMAVTGTIDNYPGFEDGVDGFSLGMKMEQGAKRFGAEALYAEVTKAELEGPVKRIHTAQGEVLARTVILATGADPRTLGLSNEWDLAGRGLHYCAHCDGRFYKDKTVAVVGGGNSAAADALYLSRLAKKVYLIHRRDTLRATKVYHQPLMEAPNVEFLWDSAVEQLLEDARLTGLRVKNGKTGESKDLAVDGVFVSIGRKPATELFRGQLDLDQGGYIVADESTRTSLPGVFAVGDVRTKALRQVVTAVADGATAVHFAEEYLAETGGN